MGKHRGNIKVLLGVCIIASALLFALILPAVKAWAGSARTHITLRVNYDEQTRVAHVTQQIIYRNNTPVPLNELYFHVYPNAYATEQSAPFEDRDMKAAYPNGFSPGGTQILSLKTERRESAWELDGTLLRVPVASTLRPGGTVRLNVEYEVTLPENNGRFGGGENTVNLLNAFIIPAVYDSSGWRLDGYCAIGDPFYSLTMDYKAVITAPDGYVLASTGVETSKKTKGGLTTWKINAPESRDFGAVLSRGFVSAQTKTNGVKVISYASTHEAAEFALQVAVDAINCFTQRYGPYVYTEFEICSTDFFIGGMEYPGLVIVNEALYDSKNRAFLEYCVAHETGHQWFYGAVGNDQINEPWLDESLTEYSTLVYYDDVKGEDAFMEAYRRFVKPYLTLNGLDSRPIAQTIYDFSNNYEYSCVVYAKGASMWHALRKEMGDDAFFSALSAYYKKNTHYIADKANLLSFFSDEQALFLESWLNGDAP